MKFTKFIKLVGTGKKHNRDLSYEEMIEAINMILTKEASNEEIAAFLLGWRVKPETTEEFIATLDTFNKYIKRIKIENSIELGYPYDGKKNNPYLFNLIAQNLKKFDINIIVSYDNTLTSKGAISIKDLLPFKEKNLYLFNRKEYFKELSNLTEIRNKLGIRTAFNSIERLLNPANSDYALLGIFHKPFLEKYISLYKNKYKKLIVVRGNEGTFEIFSKTTIWIIENDDIKEFKIDPKDFGINYQKSKDEISIAKMREKMLNPSKDLILLSKLNSALILYIFNKVDSIEEGFDLLV